MAKYLCLSFDDGPNLGDDKTMNNMLDYLEAEKIPASFFLIGNKINEENKKVILRALSLGCDIQNHSWAHPAMAEMSEEAVAFWSGVLKQVSESDQWKEEYLEKNMLISNYMDYQEAKEFMTQYQEDYLASLEEE